MKHLRQYFCAVFLCTLSFSAIQRGSLRAAAYQPLTAEIPVHCTEAEPLTDHIYEIHIEPDSAGMPEPEQPVLQIEAGAQAAFTIALTEPGTYQYRVFEMPGSEPDVTYDSTVYLVTLFAENGDDDTLRFAVSAVTESGKKPEELRFSDEAERVTTTTEAVTTSTQTETVTTQSTKPVTEPETTAQPPATTKRTGIGVFTGDNMPVKLLFSLLCGAALTAGIAHSVRRRKKM